MDQKARRQDFYPVGLFCNVASCIAWSNDTWCWWELVDYMIKIRRYLYLVGVAPVCVVGRHLAVEVRQHKVRSIVLFPLMFV